MTFSSTTAKMSSGVILYSELVAQSVDTSEPRYIPNPTPGSAKILRIVDDATSISQPAPNVVKTPKKTSSSRKTTKIVKSTKPTPIATPKSAKIITILKTPPPTVPRLARFLQTPTRNITSALKPYRPMSSQCDILRNALGLYTGGHEAKADAWSSAFRLPGSHVRDMLLIAIDVEEQQAPQRTEGGVHFGVSVLDLRRLRPSINDRDEDLEPETAIKPFHLAIKGLEDFGDYYKRMLSFIIGKPELVGNLQELRNWLKGRVSERNWVLIVHSGYNDLKFLSNLQAFNPPDAVIDTQSMHENTVKCMKKGQSCHPSLSDTLSAFDIKLTHSLHIAGIDAFYTLRAALKIVLKSTPAFAGLDATSRTAAKVVHALDQIVEGTRRSPPITISPDEQEASEDKAPSFQKKRKASKRRAARRENKRLRLEASEAAIIMVNMPRRRASIAGPNSTISQPSRDEVVKKKVSVSLSLPQSPVVSSEPIPTIDSFVKDELLVEIPRVVPPVVADVSQVEENSAEESLPQTPLKLPPESHPAVSSPLNLTPTPQKIPMFSSFANVFHPVASVVGSSASSPKLDEPCSTMASPVASSVMSPATPLLKQHLRAQMPAIGACERSETMLGQEESDPESPAEYCSAFASSVKFPIMSAGTSLAESPSMPRSNTLNVSSVHIVPAQDSKADSPMHTNAVNAENIFSTPPVNISGFSQPIFTLESPFGYPTSSIAATSYNKSSIISAVESRMISTVKPDSRPLAMNRVWYPVDARTWRPVRPYVPPLTCHCVPTPVGYPNVPHIRCPAVPTTSVVVPPIERPGTPFAAPFLLKFNHGSWSPVFCPAPHKISPSSDDNHVLKERKKPDSCISRSSTQVPLNLQFRLRSANSSPVLNHESNTPSPSVDKYCSTETSTRVPLKFDFNSKRRRSSHSSSQHSRSSSLSHDSDKSDASQSQGLIPLSLLAPKVDSWPVLESDHKSALDNSGVSVCNLEQEKEYSGSSSRVSGASTESDDGGVPIHTVHPKPKHRTEDEDGMASKIAGMELEQSNSVQTSDVISEWQAICSFSSTRYAAEFKKLREVEGKDDAVSEASSTICSQGLPQPHTPTIVFRTVNSSCHDDTAYESSCATLSPERFTVLSKSLFIGHDKPREEVKLTLAYDEAETLKEVKRRAGDRIRDILNRNLEDEEYADTNDGHCPLMDWLTSRFENLSLERRGKTERVQAAEMPLCPKVDALALRLARISL